MASKARGRRQAGLEKAEHWSRAVEQENISNISLKNNIKLDPATQDEMNDLLPG